MAAQRSERRAVSGVAGPIKSVLSLQPGTPAACSQSGVDEVCLCFRRFRPLLCTPSRASSSRFAFASPAWLQLLYSDCPNAEFKLLVVAQPSSPQPPHPNFIMLGSVSLDRLSSGYGSPSTSDCARGWGWLSQSLEKPNGAVQMCICHSALPCHLHRPPRLSHSSCDQYSQQVRCGPHYVACRGCLHRPHERKQDACPVFDPRHLPHSYATRDSGRQPPYLRLLLRYGRCRPDWQQH